MTKDDLRARFRNIISASMQERIAWHGPYDSTGEEQHHMDAERSMAEAIATDDDLIDRLVEACKE